MGSCISQPNPLNNHHHKATTATNNNDDYQAADPDLTNMIGRDLNFMKKTTTEIQKFVDHMNVQINQACEKFEELKTRGGSDTNELDQLKMSVKKLKSQIPSKLKIHYDDDSKPHRKSWFDESINSSSSNYQVDVNKSGYLPSLSKGPKFDHTPALADIHLSFLFSLRNCPEMATIKKRFMIYLWIGEGLLPPIKSMDQNTEEIVLGKKAEDFVNEILDELTAKGFIEPIYKNCGLVVESYRMPPAIRCFLTTGPFKLIQGFAMRFRSIVNIDAAIIDGRQESLFRWCNYLTVVYLGRWQNLPLRNFFIKELPQFISKLTNLKILDLKACHNLEVVPKWIGLLKNLTHLDISECYLFDHMPKGLGALSNLQVLKRFIIGDSKDKKSCTTNDLTKLSMPRKLSISTSMKEFPTDQQLHHLQRLKFLEKLKISWSGCILRDTPSWLWSSNLKNLKKLYTRGGLLCNLDKIRATTVAMLQLKYLSNLEMPWIDIMMLFSNLIYLEKVECPGLNSFPCDQNGVWMRKDNGINEKCGERSY
ncbi:hypothetical protein CsSME_00043882 [Camellia sinensis var. sinensis]